MKMFQVMSIVIQNYELLTLLMIRKQTNKILLYSNSIQSSISDIFLQHSSDELD